MTMQNVSGDTDVIADAISDARGRRAAPAEAGSVVVSAGRPTAVVLGVGLSRVTAMCECLQVRPVVAAWPFRSETVDVVDIGGSWSASCRESTAVHAFAEWMFVEVLAAGAAPAGVVAPLVGGWASTVGRAGSQP